MKQIRQSRDQAKEKLLRYLEEFVDSPYFQKRVQSMRSKYRIPKNGLQIPPEADACSENWWTREYFNLPVEIEPKTTDKSKLKRINIELRKACADKLAVYDLDIHQFLKTYLIYNKKIFSILEQGLFESNLCKIEDIYTTLEEMAFHEPESSPVNMLKRSFTYYPVILRLHPEISQRDLVAFVQHHWPQIQHSLRKYWPDSRKTRIRKSRKKSNFIKERNQFVWENRHLPRKKIMHLLSDRYGADRTLDVGYIGKIISLEKKKRNEV